MSLSEHDEAPQKVMGPIPNAACLSKVTRRIRETHTVTDDSQGGLRGDQGVGSWQSDGTRDQICNRINELEAARDHLRARLQPRIDELRGYLATIGDYCGGDTELEFARCLHDGTPSDRRVSEAFAQLFFRTADLLAVLTEPPHEKKDNEGNNVARVVTMGEGTDSRTASEDVAGSVGPMTPDQKRHQP